MKKVQMYSETLKNMKDWDGYLRLNSGLPGPRGNLELMSAAAEAGSEEQFLHFLSFTADKAPVNSPDEFLACCGTVGLGKLAAQGSVHYLQVLRKLASDPRWRTREAVAMALQLYGETAMDALLDEMEQWAGGNTYEQRAAAAALCEPRLLSQKEQVQRVLQILNDITGSILAIQDRKEDGFTVLRKGLAYCWSVAICAYPAYGKPLFERWADCQDKDIRWIVRENLKKDRLARLDPEWTGNLKTKVQ